MARLIVCEGPNVGRVYEFRDECTLGRSLEANVRLQDTAVSRKHAKITRKVRGYFLQDLRSGNGTMLNGVLIRNEVQIKPNDRIKLGHIILQFSLEEDRVESAGMPQVQIVDVSSSTTSTILKQIDARTKGLTSPEAGTNAASLALAHQRLHTVLSISNSLQRILKLDQLLQRIASDLFGVFPPAERALVLLKDEQTGELNGHVARTRSGAALDRMEVSRTIIGEVARTKTALLSADAMADGRFMRGASVHNLKIRSMMCSPLLSEDEIIGAIYVDTTRTGQRFVEEDLELLIGISAQAGLAVQNAMMHERLLIRQRSERDLQIAYQVQKGFLPESPPRIPGYDFAAWYSAAQVVGGDFYDFVELPNNRLCIVVGDVSGKGMPAALLMAKLMSDVRYIALAETKPTEAVARLNDSFGWRAPEGRFVTLLYLVLDPAARRVECVNAGHPSALIYRRGTGTVDKIVAGENFPLGLRKGLPFTSTVWELAPGDVMALFTDGVTEAMNAEGKMYGTDRLEKTLRAVAVPAGQVLTRVLNDIDSHVGTVAQSDDLTLVCFGPLIAAKGANASR